MNMKEIEITKEFREFIKTNFGMTARQFISRRKRTFREIGRIFKMSDGQTRKTVDIAHDLYLLISKPPRTDNVVWMNSYFLVELIGILGKMTINEVE